MSHEKESRFFPNPYPDYPDSVEKLNQLPSLLDGNGRLNAELRKTLHSNLQVQLQEWEQNCKFDPAKDPSIYTGAAGNALLYLKLSEFDSGDNQDEYLKKADRLVKKCLENLRPNRFSFLCGQAGPLAIKVLVNNLRGKDYRAQLKQIRDLSRFIVENEDELDIPDEILYGRAGYLYALLLMRSKNLGAEEILDDTLIRSVVAKILSSGQSTARYEKTSDGGAEYDIPLVYYWHEKGYVGAAHGYAGILYMLLEAVHYLTEDELNTLVRPTVEFVYGLRFSDTGNYPSSLTNRDDRLVHWCHGSPGVIHMLAAAYRRFNDVKYLDAARQAADDIWHRGLLKKGCGICHGVAGNAYAFMRIFQMTNDQKYLYRAVKFAEWCGSDPKERQTRVPDRPYSLFEGLAGTVYFLADLLSDEPAQTRFPAFQLTT